MVPAVHGTIMICMQHCNYHSWNDSSDREQKSEKFL